MDLNIQIEIVRIDPNFSSNCENVKDSSRQNLSALHFLEV